MFTGIVEGTARVVSLEGKRETLRLWLEPGLGLEGLKLGASLAVNGVCLTVAELDRSRLGFDVALETRKVTNLGSLAAGTLVNLERALCLSDRLDGHLVQGHVDGTGVIRAFEPQGSDRWLVVDAGRELLDQMIKKGSVAVDGISLTIATLDQRSLACTIIPHTLHRTHLCERRAGDLVNLEIDCIGKWVRRILESMDTVPGREPPSR